MGKYEYYEKKKKYCEEMADKNINDRFLYIFFKNAAAGFEIKQKKLTLAEA